MKALVSLIMALVCGPAFTQSFTVDEVKDKKAFISLPEDSNLKAGDKLYVEPKANDRTLRKREHNLAIAYSGTSTNVKHSSSNIDSRAGELGVNYSYNFGYFQPGISVAGINSENDPDEVKASSTIFYARGNFIKNEPGADVIPYGVLGIGSYHEKTKDQDDGIDAEVSGNIGIAGLGITWYPFSELFAFQVFYGAVSGDLKWSGTPTVTDDIKLEQRELTFSAVLSF